MPNSYLAQTRSSLDYHMPLRVDLTIHMDVESNPGLTLVSLTGATHHGHNVNQGYCTRTYTCVHTRFSALMTANHIY